MPSVDSPSPTTRIVFVGAFASAMSAVSFLLVGELFRTDTTAGETAVVSVENLLAMEPLVDGGWVGLFMALVLLYPAYMALMSAVGMWQRRERMQIAGISAAGVLVVLFFSTWSWAKSESAAGSEWSVGVGMYGGAISIIMLLMLWRAGMWLLDDPYRE